MLALTKVVAEEVVPKVRLAKLCRVLGQLRCVEKECMQTSFCSLDHEDSFAPTFKLLNVVLKSLLRWLLDGIKMATEQGHRAHLSLPLARD